MAAGSVTWVPARKKWRMLARIWRGAVRADNAAAYARYIQETGIDLTVRHYEVAGTE